MKNNLILWVDDEIDLLKAQILFLEKFGYEVNGVYNGKEALKEVKTGKYDMVFLDQNMPGSDGLSILKEIKLINRYIPVVMVTKSQDVSLINKAISMSVTDYLVKPINPHQVLSVCKKYLESSDIQREHFVESYTTDYDEINLENEEDQTFESWTKIYRKLIEWDRKLKNSDDADLFAVHRKKREYFNDAFAQYIKKNYKDWVNETVIDPDLSVDIVPNYLLEPISNKEKVFFILIDNLRMDQWYELSTKLSDNFKIDESAYLSLLPTSTPFSRNAIFAGLFPDEIFSRYPEIWGYETEENMGMNTFEEELFKLQLQRFGFEGTQKFMKVYTDNANRAMYKNLQKEIGKDVIAMVYTFIDKFSHEVGDTSILKEFVNDELGYVSMTGSWFENSELKKVIELMGSNGYKVIITSDHGSVWGKRPLKLKGGTNISKNLRYKHGSVLYTDDKKTMRINSPKEYRLPCEHSDDKYVLATSDYYFVYPSKYNANKKRYSDSLYHGGISMEEMILPIVVLEKK